MGGVGGYAHLKSHRRNVVNILMEVFFVTLSVFTLISAVHSDKSKSNSSVILGVIGHCGGKVRAGKCNSGSYMPLWGWEGVFHSDKSKSHSSVILEVIGHCGGWYVDVVFHMSICDITSRYPNWDTNINQLQVVYVVLQHDHYQCSL